MPEIITGKAYSRREKMLYEKIKLAAGIEDVIVIIPDQFSFETDKRLYDTLGAKLFNKIETAGISALSEKIGREYGSSGSAPADDNSKLIAMYKAQSKLRTEGDSLAFYTRSLLKPGFVSECIDAVSRLSRSGATPESVRTIAESSTSGAARLSDMAVIYERYKKELSAMGLRDNLSETAYSAELAMNNKYFDGKTVFFDAFTNFSADELLLVGAAIKHAKSVTFAIVKGDCGDGPDQFADPTRTIDKIERISEEYNKTVHIIKADGQAENEPLRHIDEHYFDYSSAKVSSRDSIKVISAPDIYSESDYIAAETVRLVSEMGYTYNDIAILCGSLEEDNSIIAASCEKYDIPYFVDLKTSGLTSVPGRYLISILDACSGKTYRTEKILRLIKSPLSNFFFYDSLDIEEFCTKWGIEGDRWKEPFVVTGERAQSMRIEDNRRRIIDPLERFRNAVTDATAGEICEALYVLLDELEMSKQIYSYVTKAAENNITEAEADRSFKQVWLGLVSAIRKIYAEMKDDKISLRAFIELLTLMINSIKISMPPQKADCVRIGDADHSVMSGVKVLFIMQANEKKFPSEVKNNDLFGRNDLELLAENNIELDLSPMIQIEKERLVVYSSLTLPSHRLYVSFSETDRTGSVCAPSSLPQNLKDMFEDDISVYISDIPLSFFCTSRKTAFYTYLEHTKDKAQEIADIRRSLELDEEYAEKLRFIDSIKLSANDSLSKPLASRVFFPRHDIDLSATRVSDYYKCAFSYFCKHGLKLSTPSRIDLGQMHVGLIIHYCLEHVMSKLSGDIRVYDEKFVDRSDDDIYQMVCDAADEYVANKMGGKYSKDLAFEFTLARLKRSAMYIAVNFRNELKRSLFLPAAFEYDLTGKDRKPILTIAVDEDTKINIRGSIDRVDLYRTDDSAWVRIVDYKTGNQNFKTSEVYHGLDLQMLIYLLAATTAGSGLGDGKTLKPAGIMYSHLRSVKPKLTPYMVEKLESEDKLEDTLRLERAKVYKPDGVMSGDEVLEALNKEDEGIYTIFSFGKKNNILSASAKPVSLEELLAMEKFAHDKVVNMANRLKEGDIKADPIRTYHNNTERIPCTYCDYRSMCRNPLPLEPRTVRDEDKELFEEEIAKMIAPEQ